MRFPPRYTSSLYLSVLFCFLINTIFILITSYCTDAFMTAYQSLSLESESQTCHCRVGGGALGLISARGPLLPSNLTQYFAAPFQGCAEVTIQAIHAGLQVPP